MRQLPCPITLRSSRSAAFRAAIVAFLPAVVLALGGTSIVGAQAPGTGDGGASTYPSGLNGPGSCTQSYFGQPAGTASCSGTTSNSSATASAASTNATRTGSAQASASMTGSSGNPFAQSSSIEYEQFTVTGTSGSPNSLVYHFTTDATTSLTGGTSQYTFSTWDLFVQSTQQGTTSSGEYSGQQIWNNPTTQFFASTNAHPNASNTGYDFVMPFDPTGGAVTFNFTPSASAANFNEADASGWASIIAMLSSVDAVNAQGQTVGTVVFGTDGNGSIVLTGTGTTTPEPSTLALVATGLIGIAPIVRRKTRRG